MSLLSGEQNQHYKGYDNLYEELWKACAGPSVDLPRPGEYAYYFPQGHLEQVEESSKVDLSQNTSLHDLPSKIFCQIFDVQLLAEQGTDELYALITLLPRKSVPEPKSPQPFPDPPKTGFNSFSKILAASDIDSHCRLYIRKRDAQNCLPPLEICSKGLAAKDLHGTEWLFDHVFQGRPPRHLFTRGWSKFVTSKGLVAGDSFVLLRGDNGELRVGVRRLASQSSVKPDPDSSKKIVEVLETVPYAMTTGTKFSVHYRPRKSQFIIRLNKYLQAVKHNFSIGMRFKMQLMGEDSIERKNIGTIIGVEDIAPQWKNSAWRTLKVRWDDSTCSKGPDRVSSWEIEPLVAPIAKSLVQIGGKKLHDIISSPVLKRKRAILEVQDEHEEIGAMVEEPTHIPVVSSETVGERLHDTQLTVPLEGYEIMYHEQGVQELNIAADCHDSGPATYSGQQVNSSYSITQLTSVVPSSNQYPIEVDVGGTKQLGGLSNAEISQAVLSRSSPVSEGSGTWFLSILGDVQEEVEWQGEAPPPRQQPVLKDPLVFPQETSSTGLGSSPMVTYNSSIPSQIPLSGPSNGHELVNWKGYYVAQHCVPTLDRVIKRYPNTLSSFRLLSHTLQSACLEMLAEVVVMLESRTVGNMDEEQLNVVKHPLMDLKNNGIEMQWLERRLEHIAGVARKNVLARQREELAGKVDEASALIRQLQEKLTSVDLELEEVSSIIGAEPLSANDSVMQGLL